MMFLPKQSTTMAALVMVNITKTEIVVNTSRTMMTVSVSVMLTISPTTALTRDALKMTLPTMKGLLMLTKTRKNKKKYDNDNNNNNSDKICTDDDADALKPSFCLHNHAHNNGVVVVNKDGKQRR